MEEIREQPGIISTTKTKTNLFRPKIAKRTASLYRPSILLGESKQEVLKVNSIDEAYYSGSSKSTSSSLVYVQDSHGHVSHTGTLNEATKRNRTNSSISSTSDRNRHSILKQTNTDSSEERKKEKIEKEKETMVDQNVTKPLKRTSRLKDKFRPLSITNLGKSLSDNVDLNVYSNIKLSINSTISTLQVSNCSKNRNSNVAKQKNRAHRPLAISKSHNPTMMQNSPITPVLERRDSSTGNTSRRQKPSKLRKSKTFRLSELASPCSANEKTINNVVENCHNNNEPIERPELKSGLSPRLSKSKSFKLPTSILETGQRYSVSSMTSQDIEREAKAKTKSKMSRHGIPGKLDMASKGFHSNLQLDKCDSPDDVISSSHESMMSIVPTGHIIPKSSLALRRNKDTPICSTKKGSEVSPNLDDPENDMLNWGIKKLTRTRTPHSGLRIRIARKLSEQSQGLGNTGTEQEESYMYLHSETSTKETNQSESREKIIKTCMEEEEKCREQLKNVKSVATSTRSRNGSEVETDPRNIQSSEGDNVRSRRHRHYIYEKKTEFKSNYTQPKISLARANTINPSELDQVVKARNSIIKKAKEERERAHLTRDLESLSATDKDFFRVDSFDTCPTLDGLSLDSVPGGGTDKEEKDVQSCLGILDQQTIRTKATRGLNTPESNIVRAGTLTPRSSPHFEKMKNTRAILRKIAVEKHSFDNQKMNSDYIDPKELLKKKDRNQLRDRSATSGIEKAKLKSTKSTIERPRVVVKKPLSAVKSLDTELTLGSSAAQESKNNRRSRHITIDNALSIHRPLSEK